MYPSISINLIAVIFLATPTCIALMPTAGLKFFASDNSGSVDSLTYVNISINKSLSSLLKGSLTDFDFVRTKGSVSLTIVSLFINMKIPLPHYN